MIRGMLAAAVVALSLAGCASSVARVDHHLLLQRGTVQYEMQPLELFVMPQELEAPLPPFPASVSGEEVGPVVACVELWLSESGDVTHVGPLHGAAGCATEGDLALVPFEEAVMTTLQAWQFSPARICRFPEHLRAQMERGDCTGREVDIDKVPVRLAYAFTFERKAGLGSVQANSSLPAATSSTTPRTRRSPRTGSQ